MQPCPDSECLNYGDCTTSGVVNPVTINDSDNGNWPARPTDAQPGCCYQFDYEITFIRTVPSSGSSVFISLAPTSGTWLDACGGTSSPISEMFVNIGGTQLSSGTRYMCDVPSFNVVRTSASPTQGNYTVKWTVTLVDENGCV
jgi:hypothetical protein